ncbi:MAG: integrase arm-type DNA-binding domain-containing protein [Thermoanaerobaculia bacterium]
MKTFKITRRSLDALKAKDGSEHGTRLTDSDLAGFFVTVYSSGRVAYGVRYRVNGQRRTVALGDFPSVTPEDARKAALAVLGGAARGEDEAAKRKAARGEAEAKAKRITFAKWRAEYVTDAARRLKSTRDPERYLAMAGEEWDARPLAEITTRDVETFRNRIAKAATSKAAKGGSTQANRWLANVRAAFSHALRLGYIEKNPFVNVQHLPENPPRQRVLSEAEEKRLRKAVETWPNPFEKAAFVLLLDTGARLSEVLKAKWEDFDLDEKTHAGTWRIPSPKAGRPQAQPILPSVGKVIAATPRLVDAPFLVVGRVASARRADLKKPWNRLREAAEIPKDLHVHDLRRSYGLRATRAQGIFAASKLLRHANSGVTERVYAPLSAENVRDFAERTERARVLAFAKRKKSAKA